MTILLADKHIVQDALSRTGFEEVTSELRRATLAAVELDDLGGHEFVMPFEAYDMLKRKVEGLWRELSLIVQADAREPDYWSRERQYARLERLQQHRFREQESLVWGLLLIHAERIVHDEQLIGPRTPRINRLAFGLGFVPDFGLGEGRFNLELGLRSLSGERYGAFPHTPEKHVSVADTIAAFIHFYHSKLGRLMRVSLRRRIELIEMNQRAVDALDFLKTTGEIYRGWLMVGFSFLAPYALAPELVAAGGVVTTTGTTGIRAATQAEQVASYVASATEGSRAMFAIMDLGPSLFDLALTLAKIFHGRENKPLTPGEVFEIIMSGLGAIPSARLGYFMMGMTIASPFQATQDFIAWLIQAIQSAAARFDAAQADLELEAYDSVHTFVLDLD
jgi:hypothetical protein